MQIEELIAKLEKEGIDYLETTKNNQYLFTDGYVQFLIGKRYGRYETNISYVDNWLRRWQNSY